MSSFPGSYLSFKQLLMYKLRELIECVAATPTPYGAICERLQSIGYLLESERLNNLALLLTAPNATANWLDSIQRSTIRVS